LYVITPSRRLNTEYYANILTISTNRQLGIALHNSFPMWALKHFIGCIGLAITLDYLTFNGYCTDVCSQMLSRACGQMLFELQHLKMFL